MDKGNLDIELYNLAVDSGENNNVAHQNPKIVKDLRLIMKQQHIPSENFPLRSVDTLQQKEKFINFLREIIRW